MRISAILETSLKAGGAHNQSLNALIQMKRICAARFDLVVIAFDLETVNILKDKGLNSIIIKFSIIEKLKNRLLQSAFWNKLFSEKVLLPIETRLLEIDTDLVYFLGPSLLSLKLKKLNFIFTLFDLAHRDHPEFPEVREYNEFRKRDDLYSKVISQSFLTLTDSCKLSENASRFYGVDSSRLISMPFGPSPDLYLNSIEKNEVTELYKLPDIYFYYPAQFWPHKNHFRILDAIALLNKLGIHYQLVLSGGNKGNLDYLRSIVKKLNLSNQVHFLGLVPSTHIKGLFQGSIAVVMPTYFGPTNLPPLEAWELGVPLIYSNHLSDHVEDAALLVDPDNSESLADAMQEVVRPEIRDNLIDKGFLRLEKINNDRKMAEIKLLERLEIFEQRLKCWGK